MILPKGGERRWRYRLRAAFFGVLRLAAGFARAGFDAADFRLVVVVLRAAMMAPLVVLPKQRRGEGITGA